MNKPKLVLLSVLLPVVVFSAITLNSTTQIDIQITKTINVPNTNADACGKMQITSSKIYHKSAQNEYQVWSLSDLSVPMSQMSFSTICPAGVIDFVVDSSEIFMETSCSSTPRLSFYLFGSNKYPISSLNTTLTAVATRIFLKGTTTIQYYPLYYTNKDVIITRQINHTIHNLSSQNIGINLSPNKNIIVLWDANSNVYIYNSTTYAIMHTYTPTNPPTSSQCTQKVNFNLNSTLIVIQTDTFNPIVVFSLISFTVEKSIPFQDNINDVQFVDSADHFLHIVGSSTRALVDLSTLNVYPQNITFGNLNRVTKWNNKIYACEANVISEFSFVVTASNQSTNNTSNNNSYSPYNNSINESSSTQNSSDVLPYSNSSNESSSTQNSTDVFPKNNSFYRSLNLSDIQQQINSKMAIGLNYMMQVTSKITSISAATPFTIYFLTFINYFSFSGIYVLINMRLPEHLYIYLTLIYGNMNADIFSMFSLKLTLPPISTEKVNRSRPLYFQVSSDVLSSNFAQIVLICSNLIVLAIWGRICCFLNKNSIIRRFYNDSKQEMLYGQIIGITLPIMLPLRYILLQGGVLNIGSKINFLLSTVFAQISIVFFFIYLYDLVSKRKLILTKNEALQERNIKVGNKFIIRKITEKRKTSFSQLFTIQIFDKWFLYLANIIYPLFVLSDNPIYFLLVVMAFTLTNLLITLKAFRKNKNLFFLKLYPLIFHSCFFVFYFSQDSSTLIIAQMICIVSLLAGSVHNLLTTIASGLSFFFHLSKAIFKCGKVSPDSKNQIISQGKIKKKISQHPTCKNEMKQKENSNSIISNKARTPEISKFHTKIKKCKDAVPHVSKFNYKIILK